MIFVNFKTYQQGTGGETLKLVKLLENVADDLQLKVIPVVQASDVKEAVLSSALEIWTQHIDPVEFGAHTGSVIPEAVFEDGAVGTFLNHSEKKFDSFETLKKAHDRAQQVGLKTLVFVANIDELKKFMSLNPTYIAYEPPELVGSKTTSVAKAKPEVVKEAVELAREKGLPLIVGAGIKSHEDYSKSLEFGAAGIAVASSIVAAKDAERELRELVEGVEEK